MLEEEKEEGKPEKTSIEIRCCKGVKADLYFMAYSVLEFSMELHKYSRHMFLVLGWQEASTSHIFFPVSNMITFFSLHE